MSRIVNATRHIFTQGTYTGEEETIYTWDRCMHPGDFGKVTSSRLQGWVWNRMESCQIKILHPDAYLSQSLHGETRLYLRTGTVFTVDGERHTFDGYGLTAQAALNLGLARIVPE